jgi:hypothetical protein
MLKTEDLDNILTKMCTDGAHLLKMKSENYEQVYSVNY